MFTNQEDLKTENFNISKATHPFICLFHLGLKAGAIFSYLFLTLITNSSIHTFISVVIFDAVDFWFVKNVSGRILVGLRWWNGEEETGKEGWVFESYNVNHSTSEIDKYIFWWGQSVSTIFWGCLLLVKILAFSVFWGMLVFIGFSLSLSNLYGYYLCKKDHEEKVKKMIEGFGSNYGKYYEVAKKSFKAMTKINN